MRTTWTAALGAVVWLMVLPRAAEAQTGAAQMSGVVRDTTGGILPGVTVEASSPALIEKVRSVITDDAGQYRILDLRPGVYTVTFTLPGFSVVRRDGIELTTNFTATVNADLRVGDVSETITVSASSPVVDVQNVVQQRTLTRDVLDAIPTGKYYQNYAVLTPGIIFKPNVTNSNADVGGMLGNVSAQTLVHGSYGSDQQILLDGMNVTTIHSNSVSTFNPTDGSLEEVNFMIGANPAEAEVGGVRINLVPKEGGNVFKGTANYQYTSPKLQTDNVDDELTRAGLVAPNKLVRQWDVGATLGGPVKRDRVWFFGGYRYFPNDRTVGGIFYAKDPKAFIYQPDTSRPGIQDSIMWDANSRVTIQAAPKHKIAAFFDYNYSCDCHRYIAATRAPEASLYLEFRNRIAQFSWSSPTTNRLLLEAGASVFWWDDTRPGQPEAAEIPIVEQSRNLLYRSRSESNSNSPGYNRTYRASVSYIAGPHSLKAGTTVQSQHILTDILPVIGDVQYRVLNGIPNQVTYSASPYTSIDHYGPNIGIFAQDQWIVGRLTVNPGLRVDWLRTSYPAISLPATRWMVARSFEGAEVSDWKDVSPRLSTSYDVFGDGKTAIKVSLNRYVVQSGRETISSVNPVLASNNTTTRTWNDGNGDRVVQGDPLNPEPNGELGPQANRNFGRTVLTFHGDPTSDFGFQIRPYNWEVSTGVHDVLPPLVRKLQRHRQPRDDFSRLRPVLRHGAERRASAGRGRLPDLRTLRCHARQVRPRRQLAVEGRGLRRTAGELQRCGRDDERAAAQRHHPAGRDEHGQDNVGQLRRRHPAEHQLHELAERRQLLRQLARRVPGWRLLPYRDQVAHPGEVRRIVSTAPWRTGERDLSERARRAALRQLRRVQRARAAVARAQSLAGRERVGDAEYPRARHRLPRSLPADRPAGDERVQGGRDTGPRDDRSLQRAQCEHRDHGEPDVFGRRLPVAGTAGHHGGPAGQIRRADGLLRRT
jgi:hypothetical protein